MKMKTIISGLVLLALVGCSQTFHKKTFVTMEIANAFSKPLDWVKVVAGDRQLFSAGILIPASEKTHLDYVWSNMPNQARVTFVDEQTRQRYNIDIVLTEANAKVLSGQCKRVTIRILDYDKAEVVCK